MENNLPKYITLTENNIDKDHICCAFSDKKCLAGYELKKEWLTKEFANGYVFRRLDARAKVFIESRRQFFRSQQRLRELFHQRRFFLCRWCR